MTNYHKSFNGVRILIKKLHKITDFECINNNYITATHTGTIEILLALTWRPIKHGHGPNE